MATARPILSAINSNGNRQQPVDDTLPLKCFIETSQLIDGHGVYSIRVTRTSNDPFSSWLITKRFREFFDFSNTLKDFGFDFELPKKKILGNTDRTFMAERQQGLQAFLDVLVKQIDLSSSIIIQRFLDPERHLINYSELALQHVSMFIRSTNNTYQNVEEFTDLGWRNNKTYFLASKTGTNKDERYLLAWCHYGLDKAFGEREVFNCLRLVKSVMHPLLVPIDEVYANELGTLVVYRFYPKGSLKDFINQTKPNGGPYWKRYNRKSLSRICDLNQIKTYGRQILEALNFIYSNGLVYGHLHSGNILFDPQLAQPIRLLDLSNVITGVSPKYRGHIFTTKPIRTLEQCDVYGFGRVLYELSTGQECPTSTCVDLPNTIDVNVQRILSSILSTTGDLPTLNELINDPFFQNSSAAVDQLTLKLKSKAKEAFEQISRTAQTRLEADQTKVKTVERQTKQITRLLSDEEKTRRRREKLAKTATQNFDPSGSLSGSSKTIQRSISVDPLQLSTERTQARRPLTPNPSLDLPPSPQSPPPVVSAASPPPPPPPPPPAPPAPPASGDADRTHLLSSITDFSMAKLKKAKTNDRSAPKVK